MPTYGYRCPHCGTEFDVRQRMSDAAGAACTACGKPALRLFFAPAIVFNGSGFYKTDSRGNGAGGNGSAKPEGSTPTPATAAPAAATATPAGGDGAGPSTSTAATTSTSPPTDASSGARVGPHRRG